MFDLIDKYPLGFAIMTVIVVAIIAEAWGQRRI